MAFFPPLTTLTKYISFCSIIPAKEVPWGLCCYPTGSRRPQTSEQTILSHRGSLQQKGKRWQIYRAAGFLRSPPEHLQRETRQLQL